MDSGHVAESTAVQRALTNRRSGHCGKPSSAVTTNLSFPVFLRHFHTHKLTHLHSPVDQLTVTFRRTVDIPQPAGHNPRGFPSLAKVKKQNATKTKDFIPPLFF